MSNTNPDAPVRIEVAMPRSLYDRLTDHDEAPRSRYDAATGRAEYVADPGIGHEWRAAGITGLFAQIALALEQAGRSVELLPAGATRLLSDDGAFEPDSCLFVGAAAVRAAARLEGYLDTRKGHPAPDPVVEGRPTTYRGSSCVCMKRSPLATAIRPAASRRRLVTPSQHASS